jgi:hypothetical protein
MVHVRRHERQVAPGKTTTVRAHEREGGDSRPAPEWATPARASDLREASGRPDPQQAGIWDGDDEQDGDWWAEGEEAQPAAPVWPRGDAEPDSPALTNMKRTMRWWRKQAIHVPPAVPDTSPLGRALGTHTQEGADHFARLKAYREAGYDGPLNQDNQIPDPDDPAEQAALDILAELSQR